MAKPLLSFVIPCYRSAGTIGAVVQEIAQTVAARADEYDHAHKHRTGCHHIADAVA